MNKVPLLRDDTDGSKYAAWCPMFGTFDVRQLDLFVTKEVERTYDTDLDVYAQTSLDERYLIA